MLNLTLDLALNLSPSPPPPPRSSHKQKLFSAKFRANFVPVSKPKFSADLMPI